MLSECGQQEHSHTMVRAQRWTRLPYNGDAHTCRVTALSTRQQQLLVRRGPGLAAGGALWNLLVQRIGALRSVLARTPTARGRKVICNIRRKLCSLRWHFSHNQPAMWSWRKSLSRWTDARLQVVQQMSTVRPSVPSPSLDDLRDVCGSFSAYTATGSDKLHPGLHLKHVCDDALRAIAMIMTLAANIGTANDHRGVVTQTDGQMETHWAAGLPPRWTRRAIASSWE